ncbi:MAG TPA: hypothetical protein PKO06_16195 [Candidatus Ozemobacteraceae bacterium]|nr:hypothetical protein [Candidatus Ozemobacteraceae bacterium]
MTIDLIVFLVVVGFLVFIGLPTIRNTITLPSEMAMEKVSKGQLSQKLTAHFAKIDSELSEIGFKALETFRVTNLGSDNMLRLYLHADRQTFALATCLAQNTPDGRIGENYLEFIDEFEDGRSLTTRNSEITSVFASDPRKPLIVAANAVPAELYRLHREARQQYTVAGRSWSHADELLKRGSESHREMCEFQVSCGRLEFEPATQRFRATWKLALIGLVNFVNPLSDHFTWFRFVGLVIVVGLLPIIGTVGLAALAQHLSLSPSEMPLLLMGCRVVLFGFAGLIVGWTFPGKVFIWSFLATYLPQITLIESNEWTFVYSIWAAFVGERVSSWQLSRRDLLREERN